MFTHDLISALPGLTFMSHNFAKDEMNALVQRALVSISCTQVEGEMERGEISN